MWLSAGIKDEDAVVLLRSDICQGEAELLLLVVLISIESSGMLLTLNIF